MSEFFEEPANTLYDPPLNMQTMTSQELMEMGTAYQDSFLIHRAHERRVVEAAEEILREGEE